MCAGCEGWALWKKTFGFADNVVYKFPVSSGLKYIPDGNTNVSIGPWISKIKKKKKLFFDIFWCVANYFNFQKNFLN